jgi:hypothetical protein
MSISRVVMALIVVTSSTGVCQFKERPQPVDVNLGSLQEAAGDAASQKSVLLGVALSLVLPGAGEWYAGNLSTGQYFMGADGILWLSYAGVSLRGNWIRDDARLYASEHAGASMEGKAEKYEVDLGNFQSMDEYNQAKLRNREFDLLYDRPDFVWNWDTEKNRLEYRALRIRSDEYFQNAKFFVGALVVNRIISAFSAWRSVNRHNKGLETSGGWDLKAEIQGGLPANNGLAIKLSKSF